MSKFQIFSHTPTLLYPSLLFLLTLLAICKADSVSGVDLLKTREIDAVVSRGRCSEKIGGCFEESEMESEISRRVLLMQKKYISYGTLRRDLVPCDKPGASYYDCNARQAHRYSRGCEVITRGSGVSFHPPFSSYLFGGVEDAMPWNFPHPLMEDLRLSLFSSM
ncbi:hypothetical protein SADUNF_Sadunf16G0198700 [Salix dunnii]|uniref:Uncharacterized protein n=1 Tax=Salix dunnii TaxID=1413687 RepID=A0A835JD25_9ROSI|nr:hypothetical protein SADUNF_Sadunf16G0198700 [Salix dunnii]